ncbi:hypothetical protein USDA257_c35180 [Sinorhizobium fredii USDA 257]|uniref:Uncharacterized protein n=1 Tax=Sinorhizobium fredii (strain USDA 257) TaxID=1185652 RepID=I3X871_SINF2|nr:hypothetical protein USDA257_c35180 [Sinorhizobium fredii USDA 257]
MKTRWKLIERCTGGVKGKINAEMCIRDKGTIGGFYSGSELFQRNLLKLLAKFQFFTSKMRKSATSLDPHGF